ncbi:MAG: hypothetical protein EXR55_04260 [Dehalococcoidia bacterium]|nr:hypothetical protein [Dehalococcoidia bacterium]
MTTGWVRITDLTNPQQKAWFDGSKPVYKQLFPSVVGEPHENLADYIRDTEYRRLQGQQPPEPEDFYYVGVVDDSVWEMMFYTAYPERHHGFVAYMGIPREEAKPGLSPAARRYLGEEMINRMMSDYRTADCTSFLFELEPVEPEKLALRRSRGQITDDGRAVRDRIHVTDLFQRRGARKIGWIRYRQPMLKWKNYEQEVPMHLMCVPVSQTTPRREFLDRIEVRRFVEFIYLTFYYDGFKQIERGKPGGTTLLRGGEDI